MIADLLMLAIGLVSVRAITIAFVILLGGYPSL